ncbi:hypothetical protein ACF07Y_46440 [Streptomyces sp. NPDC016566]|uniref:hypothetical protein n=1 Tax=Streptomyces sp. NPDC016566 TaxID=3364967 RepID=UPI0036F78BEB
MASTSDPWRPRRLHPPVSDVLPAPEHPTIAPGATPSWPGHEYGPTPVPPPVPSTPGLPEGVRRTRTELEALRDDAAREFHAGEHARVQLDEDDEYQVRRPAVAAQGVWAVAAWLLGELQSAPISGETHEYPYTALQVGDEKTHAIDCLQGSDWPDVDHDYAAGVRHTVGWAFWDWKARPVPPAAA